VSAALELPGIPGIPREALAIALAYRWELWSRPEQRAPEGDWVKWLYLAGRGAGKTRAGGEWVREQAQAHPGCRIHLVAPTASDARDVMLEGASGILRMAPPWFRPTYEPSRRRLIWPNGSLAYLFSAEEPDRMRGPQCHFAWVDEVATWARPETWEMMLFGLRLGQHPQVCVTTTPKPVRLVRELLVDPTCTTTRGTTMRNAKNLAPTFLREIVSRYEGTRLYRQEVLGEYLEEAEGALWARDQIDRTRVVAAPELVRIVVAIDPAVTSDAESDETGIVAAGLGRDGHGYVLEDISGHFTPDAWAQRAVAALDRLQADRIIGEANNGGDLIEHTLRTVRANVPYRKVIASRGKAARAEPVAALYEQGRVHHVGGFAALEDQLCGWEPLSGDRSPDRLDALVWALSELMLEGGVGWDDAHTLSSIPVRKAAA
jgi:phage terminase large subunit-like protein